MRSYLEHDICHCPLYNRQVNRGVVAPDEIPDHQNTLDYSLIFPHQAAEKRNIECHI